MKFFKFLLIQIIWFRLTVRTALWKLITLMSFFNFFNPLLLFILFNFFDHFSRFLWHVTVWLLSRALFISLLLFCGQRRIIDFSCLKLSFIVDLPLVIFFTFGSIRFHYFELIEFLFSLQFCLFLIIKELKIVFKCFCNFLTHELIFFSRKRNVFLLFLGIIKPGGYFNSVAMRDISENNCSCCGSFELSNTKKTWIVPKNLSTISK